jgi:PAS domain S-box-containing protein
MNSDHEKKKVLLVDNHPVILKFMTQLLTKNGYHVMTAQDGLAALVILEDYNPDVVFVDLVMPNISGDKLCQIIRGMPGLEDVYLIILSAVAAEQLVNFTEFGANACIAKGPFNEMAKNVMAALDKTHLETPQVIPEGIFGLEDVHLREITKELLSVKKHLEVIMMGMSEGILELNHDSRIVYANPSVLSLLDIPEERLLGSYFPALFQGEAGEKVKGFLKTLPAPSREDQQDQTLILNEKEITLNISPIQDQENNTIVVLNDVTDKKRMEAKLQQAQKMEAVGTLAGGIAHDFNNLLMAIQGTVSLILFNMDPTHPLYDKINSIEKQVESGSRLTKQLLGYARKGKYEVKPIKLNQLVEETAETFGRTRKEITIHLELADNIFTTEVDEGQIEQVLLNLFVNAANAMPNGGHLTLKAQNTNYEHMRGKLYKPKPGNYVVLTITDTGTGMDEKTRERIFEPFFTTGEMGCGTGLGLASTYGIIKNHGGYIDVESQKDLGTTFKIYLPASDKAVQGVARPPEEIAKGNETILLVDDEAMILEIGKQLLEAMGYSVLTASNGKEAVEVYKAKKDKIDILILDMIMPEMGGGEIYDTMKQINPDIKVLLSSGYSVEGKPTEILDRGCNGFIQKPFHMAELSQSIRKILSQ